MSGNNVKKEDKKDKKDKLVCKLNASGEPELSLNIDCVEDLIEHIKGKKRRLDLYRKILELKYNRYKKCHNFWSISTILLKLLNRYIWYRDNKKKLRTRSNNN